MDAIMKLIESKVSRDQREERKMKEETALALIPRLSETPDGREHLRKVLTLVRGEHAQ